MVQLPFLCWTASTEGICKPDTSFAVYGQVIGPVVPLPIEPVG